MTMREKTARAIWAKKTKVAWDDAFEEDRQAIFDQIDLTIEAMMEPTEAMYVAFIENTDNVGIPEATGKAQLAACKSDWQAMLKAATHE